MQILVVFVALFAVVAACRDNSDCRMVPCADGEACYCDQTDHRCVCRPEPDILDRPVSPDITRHTRAAADDICVLCEFIMVVLSDIIQENSSRTDIQYAFDCICSLMPDTISNECTAFVNTYTSLIINVLVNDIADPHEVCRTIKICKSRRRRDLPGKKIRHERALAGSGFQRRDVKADDGCILCEFIMVLLDEFLEDNATTSDIQDVLKFVCALMPDTITNECVAFVFAYTPLIINVLENDIADPHEVCRTIKICKSVDKQGFWLNSSAAH